MSSRPSQRTGSSNAAISASASQKASTACSNNSRPRSAVAGTGSPMWPSGPKSFDSQPNPTAPPNRTYRLSASSFGHVAGRRRHVDQIRCQVQHHRGLVGAAVDAHAELVGCRDAALIGWHAGVCEERHQAVGESDLAVRHADERRVAAVSVEEHQLAGRGGGDAAADVVEHCEQRGGRQPDRARRPGVLVRLGVRQRRQQPDVEVVADPFDRCLRHAVGDERGRC